MLYQEDWDNSDPWVLVLYQEDWNSGGPSGWRLDSRGIPSGVSLGTNSPEDGDDSTYTSNSKRRWCDWGSVIYTKVAWATAITESQLIYCLY